MALEQELTTLATDAVGGVVTVDSVTVTPAGRRRVVRITVDRPVDDPVGDRPIEPLTLDEIAEVTRTLSEALDGDASTGASASPLGSQPYTLEVTTPGTDRPLTAPVHYRRAVGRLVEFTPLEGPGVTARVLATTAEGVDVEVPADRRRAAQTQHYPFAGLARGVVQVEFNRAGAQPAETADDADETESS